MIRAALALALALVVAAAPALAAPGGADLHVRRDPASPRPPASLAMRAGATAEEPPSAPSAPSVAGGGAAAAPPATVAARFEPLPTDLDDLSDRVTFRFQLGYEVSQGQLSGDPLRGTGQPLEEIGNRNTRLYTLGDAVVGTRGMLVPSLVTYLAASFRFDQAGRPGPTSVPSVVDVKDEGGALLIRSGWAELDGLPGPLLGPLHVRAGRQFRHAGPVLHFDGLAAAYDTRPVEASVFVGRRVVLYRPDAALAVVGRDPGVVAGAGLRLRLARVTGAPLALGFDWFSFEGERGFLGSFSVGLDGGASLTADARLRDQELARFGARLRLSVSSTTIASVEVDHRRDPDWTYDLVISGRELPLDDERRRLQLDLSPRLRVGARAGTVLWDNLDVLMHAAVAFTEQPTAFSPRYWETGTAVEGRFRHGVTAGTSLRLRRYRRPDPADHVGFFDLAATGERSFEEVAIHGRYVIGARRFKGEGEIYARASESATSYVADEGRVIRPGLRFRIEGWLGASTRLLGEYEVSAANVTHAPELDGLQSLRLIAEASF